VIRDSLAMVVVSRRLPERLPDLLKELAADKVSSDVIVVNLTGTDLSLSGCTVVNAPATLSLSHAVDRALGATTAENIWILRDDIRIRSGACAELASVLDTSPSVGVVGPKQMDAETPATIREMGESMTRSGFAVQLAERELDQAQYDRTSDVLAVGEAGMLVRREVWSTLGGFDPALPGVDGALDFCFRARSAGWRIEVVPTAVIETQYTSLEALAGPLTESRVVREESRARAHRVLATTVAIARPFVAVGLSTGALVRGIGRFVQKRRHSFSEWRGTMAALVDIGAVSRAHAAFRRINTVPVDGSRLFVSRAELRHRRAMARDESRALLESIEDTPRLRFGATAFWWAGFATVAGIVLNNRLLGANAVAGGALVPMPATIEEAWSAVGATWSEVASGFTGTPDGFASLLGVLSTLFWWNPNALIVTLLVAVIPLSFIAGYVGAGVFTTNTRAALFVGAGWALVPTVHIAVNEGRITAVIAHIALPLFARAIAGSSVVALGWASILGAVLWVSVPALAPVVLLAVIIRVVTGNPGALVTLAPALAFEWPRLLAALGNPITYFADRGVPFPSSAPTGLFSLTLWPATPSLPFVTDEISLIVAGSLVAALVALTVIAVVVADNPRVGALLGLGGFALAIWFALGAVPLATAEGVAVGLFPGPLYDVVWFGLIAGAGITVASARIVTAVLAPTSITAMALIGAIPLTAVFVGSSLIEPSTVRTLPAYVEAESTAHPGGATLVVTPTPDGLRAELQRDGGVTLVDWSAAAATRTALGPNEFTVAEIAANLIVESGFDVSAALAEQQIRFVLLEAKPTATEVSSIASHAGLTSVGATDRGILWRVDGDNTAKPTDRDNDVVYLAILGIVGLIALVAAVPTSLPRRRAVVEDDIPLSGEDDDGNS
jgi:hypothetical protein